MIPAAIDAAFPCARMEVLLVADPDRPEFAVRCGACANCETIKTFMRNVRSQALEDAAALCDSVAAKCRLTTRMMETWERVTVATSVELAAAIRGKKVD